MTHHYGVTRLSRGWQEAIIRIVRNLFYELGRRSKGAFRKLWFSSIEMTVVVAFDRKSTCDISEVLGIQVHEAILTTVYTGTQKSTPLLFDHSHFFEQMQNHYDYQSVHTVVA